MKGKGPAVCLVSVVASFTGLTHFDTVTNDIAKNLGKAAIVQQARNAIPAGVPVPVKNGKKTLTQKATSVGKGAVRFAGPVAGGLWAGNEVAGAHGETLNDAANAIAPGETGVGKKINDATAGVASAASRGHITKILPEAGGGMIIQDGRCYREVPTGIIPMTCADLKKLEAQKKAEETK